MASKKAGSAAKTNRDSNPKMLGVKMYGGQAVISGNIIVRQKGNHFYSGIGTKQGNDFTIYAITSGKVEFIQRQGKKIVTVNGQ